MSLIDTAFGWWKHGDEPAHAAHELVSGASNGATLPGGNLHHPATPTEPPWLTQMDRAGLPRTLVYPNMTLGRLLDQTAERFGPSTAIVYNHHTWSWQELREQVNRLAGGLAQLGVRRGERVILTLPNCPEFIIAFFAIQKLGAVVVNPGGPGQAFVERLATFGAAVPDALREKASQACLARSFGSVTLAGTAFSSLVQCAGLAM